MNDQDAHIRQRMLALESGLQLGAARRPDRRRRLGLIVAAGVAFGAAFAGGALARDLVEDHSWRGAGLFTPGGPLYCTDLQGMSPREAAPILEALGYHVTWQDERGDAGGRQSEIPPDSGYVTDGISKGRQLIVLADDEPLPPSRCE